MTEETERDHSLSEWADSRQARPADKLKRWQPRWRSGVVRAAELSLGSRSSWEWLASDFSTLAHLPEVRRSIRSVSVLEEATRLEPRRLPPDIELPDPQTFRPAVFITELAGVSSHIPSGLVQLPSGHLYFGSDGVLQMGLVPGGAAQEMHDLARARRRLSGSWATASATQYYYHHVVDTCVPLLKAAKAVPGLRVAAPPGQSAWYYDVLTTLGIDWITVPEVSVKIEHLVIVDRAPLVRGDVELLRAHAPEAGITDPIDALFISRRGLPRFDAQAEQRLLAALAPLEVTAVDPSRMSITEQIETFGRARIVLGAHGGALTNLVWSRRARVAVEVFARGFRGLEFSRIAQAAGIPYLPCVPEDLSGLSRAVQSILPT